VVENESDDDDDDDDDERRRRASRGGFFEANNMLSLLHASIIMSRSSLVRRGERAPRKESVRLTRRMIIPSARGKIKKCHPFGDPSGDFRYAAASFSRCAA